MKKQITKGVVIGAIVALTIVVYFINFPKYTCQLQQGQAEQLVNCNPVMEFTPGFIFVSFVIFMIIGGGAGWIYNELDVVR
jgi:large-conductance mechanosensitive channel